MTATAISSTDQTQNVIPPAVPIRYLCVQFPATPEGNPHAIPWHRRVVWPCIKGQIIATVIECNESPSDSIHPVTIPLETAEIGHNTEWNEGQTALIASKSGRIHVRRELIEVEEIWEMNDDLDASSGPIDFPGEINLHKNVLDLVRLSADGDITVHGSIEAANVHSKGNIVIHHGICGKERGLISAAGNISSRFASNARIHAGGDIRIDKEIASSELISRSAVLAERGSILSGHISAQSKIVCYSAGSEAAVRVLLELSLSGEEIAQIGPVLTELKTLRTKAEQIRASIEPLMKDPKRLTNQQKEKATELLCSASEFEEKAADMTKSLDVFRKQLDLVMHGVVEIKGHTYPEVTVSIAGVQTTFKNERKGTIKIMRRDDGSTPQLVAIDTHNQAVPLPTTTMPVHTLFHTLRTGGEGVG